MQTVSTQAKVIAVIPCYNEQTSIHSIAKETLKYVKNVIVINDGSMDKTEEEAIKAGALVLNHPGNLGKGAALMTAFNYLHQFEYDAVVVLDGDGQHDPAEIVQIVEPVLNGTADMVIGSRFLEGAHKIPFYRKIGLQVLNYVTNWGSRIWISDSQSGYRSFSKKLINEMEIHEKGFSVESEMQFIAGRKGFKVVEVPISTIYKGKAKRNPLFHGCSVLMRVLYYAIFTPGISTSNTSKTSVSRDK